MDPRLTLKFSSGTVTATAARQLAHQGSRHRQQLELGYQSDGDVEDGRARRSLVVAGGDCHARRTASSLVDGTAVHVQDLQHTERV